MYTCFLLLDVSRRYSDIPATFIFLPVTVFTSKLYYLFFISLYSESAGRLSVIFMFYWCDLSSDLLKYWGSVVVTRWVSLVFLDGRATVKVAKCT